MTAKKPIVIAHRGACGYLPEHTLAAYAMAYALGADYIEPDLVMTADRALICLHDIYLEPTTDVAARFPDRARADGRWYAADFSLAEIQQLSAVERKNPDGSRVFSGRFNRGARGFKVPTFAALLDLVQSLNRQSGRDVGVYPETKAPEFHAAQGLAMEGALLALLAAYGYRGRGAKVFIQSFSETNLAAMGRESGLPTIQLIDDSTAQGHRLTPAGLDAIAAYADGIGPDKRLITAGDGGLVRAAHARGLVVHPYTFRADELPPGTACLEDEIRLYCQHYGVDGLFTDFADIAVGVVHPQRRARLYPEY